MKFVLIVAFTFSVLIGQRFPVTTFQELGPRGTQINVVFLAEGYRQSEMGKFRSDIQSASNALFDMSPYKEYKNLFNVYGIEVPSNQSGTDHPKTASDCPSGSEKFEADTYFNSTFDRGDTHRLLVIDSHNKAYRVLQYNLANWDIGFVIVNHSMYGGSGGTWAVFSTHSSAPQIAIHEAGHAFANLADEYDYGGGGREAPNATAVTNRSDIKWKAWIKDATPIPTPETNQYNNVIGLFEGAVYETNDWYRPKLNCMMKSLGYPFCEVCIEQTILTIYDVVNPFSYHVPEKNNLKISYQYQGLFEIDKRDITPNSIKVDWYLDSTLIRKNTDQYLLNGQSLSAGNHTVMASVKDTTQFVRTDPQQFRTSTLTWKLEVGALLDIKDPEWVPNTLSLSPIYPNPFNPATQLTFNLPSAMPITLSVMDIKGRVIDTLINGMVKSGVQSIRWEGISQTSGVYFFKLETPMGIKIQKGILLK